MAQQGPELSTAHNNWWEVQPNPFSWTAITQCRSDATAAASFADASSHSALSMDSSSADVSGEPAENRHMWSHVLLLDVEDAGEVDDGENFIEVLSSRRLTACANSKKMDSCRELHPSSLHSLGSSTMLPDFASNCSIAPPSNPQLVHHLAPSTCNNYFSASMLIDHLASDTSHVKHEIPVSPPFTGDVVVGESSRSYYEHNVKLRSHQTGLNHDFSGGMAEASWSHRRSPSYQVPFGGCLSKQASMELPASKPRVKGSDLCCGNKQAYERSSIRGNCRNTGTVEGKKKRSDGESAETLLKKSKYDSSMVSSNKLQVPKAKMAAERISALQQIVSPFGKTDQASVLMETIFCIRSLQEQIQLLSDPFMKSGDRKDQNSWGELERKVKAQAEVDLRSKGLCLVPISSILQVHRDNSRPEYWMPTYRSFYKLEPSCVVDL
ncbi:hypothetical protein OPV22_030479 [Ensete ventricosum]|uniref:BHLH domain-containing protein n=1 Tax=Ensete ventricosum TaxID=4639 RepID=A0AAV8P658_ENSVE|nr:hypothetical protein OPV22_030479 [Ensete ventricosum]